MRYITGRVVILVLACATLALAQEPRPQQLNAPPPLKVISSDERTLLNNINDNKGRVRKTVELAEAHLLKAEGFTSQEQFTDASSELGKYWALIEDVLKFLSPLKQDSNKTRDLYKKVELALRAHATRLTLMRRGTPAEYAVWIKSIEEFARTSRTEALNSFYGQTVVRENQSKHPNDKSPDKKEPLTATSPDPKQP